MNTDFHGLLSVFIRVNPCPIFRRDDMRRHERRLNTMNENPQISQITQIFLCAFAPLR